jgi:hypothetical protein
LTGALAAGLLALCSTVAAADAPAAATAKATAPSPVPRIVFDQPIHDFGEVKRGAPVEHSFIFTNTGAETLQVLEVKPGCGCTTTSTWDKEVPAGKTGRIPVQFNSAGFSGQVHKTVTVLFNDPAQSNVVLQITGKVWTPVEINPPSVFFQYAEEGTNSESRTIRIVNNEQEPLTLEPPQLTNANFRVALKTVKEGREFSIEVTTVPPMAGGTVSVPIIFKTSSKEMPVINIPVTAMARPAVMVSPTQIVLPASPLATEFHQSVSIQSFGGTGLKLSEPGCSVPGVKVELRELQPGQAFHLSAVFPAGFTTEPGQLAELHVNSSHPKFPVIRVPVMPPPRPLAARALPPAPAGSGDQVTIPAPPASGK